MTWSVHMYSFKVGTELGSNSERGFLLKDNLFRVSRNRDEGIACAPLQPRKIKKTETLI